MDDGNVQTHQMDDKNDQAILDKSIITFGFSTIVHLLHLVHDYLFFHF